MPMTDGTLLSPAIGSTGDTIDNEVVAGNPAKVSRSKIVRGARNADLGDVGPTNPFDVYVGDGAGHVLPTGDAPARSIAVEVTDGTNVLGTPTHPVRTDPTGTTPQPVSVVNYLVSTWYTPVPGSAVSAVAKGSAGNLKSLKVTNLNTAVRYLQLFDDTAVPATGVTVPKDCTPVPAGGTVILGTDDLTDAGVPFATGITWGFSTTALVFTTGVATDCIFSAVLL